MNRIHVNLKTENIATFIVAVFYFLRLLLYVSHNVFVFYSMYILGISSFAFLTKIKRKDIKSLSFLGMIYLFFLISSLYTNNLRLTRIFFNLQYIGLSILLIKYKMDYKIFAYSFYIHSAFFFYHIMLGSNPNMIFENISRNIVSVIMLIQCVLLYVSRINNNRKVTFIPALLTLLISLWGAGRSGIISSSFLMIGVTILIFSKTNFKINTAVLTILCVAIVFLILIPYGQFALADKYLLKLNYVSTYERFLNVRFHDLTRSAIVIEYLYEIKNNLISFLLGAPLKHNILFSRVSFNLHSSFLNAHAYYGLGGFIMIFFSIVLAMRRFFKDKNLFFMFLLIASLIRVSTDIVAFPGVFDPIVYYLVFYSYDSNKKSCTQIYKEGE